MDHPGGKDGVHGIKERPQYRHYQDQPTSHPPLQKCLRIPGEKSDRTDGGQVREAAFYSPVHPGGRAEIVVWRCQIVFVLILRGHPRLKAEAYCKQSSQKGEEGSPGISRMVTVQG